MPAERRRRGPGSAVWGLKGPAHTPGRSVPLPLHAGAGPGTAWRVEARAGPCVSATLIGDTFRGTVPASIRVLDGTGLTPRRDPRARGAAADAALFQYAGAPGGRQGPGAPGGRQGPGPHRRWMMQRWTQRAARLGASGQSKRMYMSIWMLYMVWFQTIVCRGLIHCCIIQIWYAMVWPDSTTCCLTRRHGMV